MFSKDLELTIGQCYKDAREQRHEFMTVEHLLLALLENPSAAAALPDGIPRRQRRAVARIDDRVPSTSVSISILAPIRIELYR